MSYKYLNLIETKTVSLIEVFFQITSGRVFSLWAIILCQWLFRSHIPHKPVVKWSSSQFPPYWLLSKTISDMTTESFWVLQEPQFKIKSEVQVIYGELSLCQIKVERTSVKAKDFISWCRSYTYERRKGRKNACLAWVTACGTALTKI